MGIISFEKPDPNTEPEVNPETENLLKRDIYRKLSDINARIQASQSSDIEIIPNGKRQVILEPVPDGRSISNLYVLYQRMDERGLDDLNIAKLAGNEITIVREPVPNQRGVRQYRVTYVQYGLPGINAPADTVTESTVFVIPDMPNPQILVKHNAVRPKLGIKQRHLTHQELGELKSETGRDYFESQIASVPELRLLNELLPSLEQLSSPPRRHTD